MSKTIEIPDIAQYEENDSELAKYTISKLQEENKKINKDLQTALDICNNRLKEIERLNNIIDELEKWLNSEIKRIEGLKNPKHSTTFAPKPYGREKEYYDIMINSYKYCLNKLKELKEGK